MRVLLLSLAFVGGCGWAARPSFPPLGPADLRFPPAPRALPMREAEDLLRRDTLGLEEYLRLVEALNPDLAAAGADVDIAEALAWEASLRPNPSAFVEVEDWKLQDGAGSSKVVGGLRLPIPLSGRIGAATAAALSEREAAAMAYAWKRREVLTEAKRAFADLLVRRRMLEFASQTRDLAARLSRVVKERTDAGVSTEMEALKAAVNLASAEAALRAAEADAAVAGRTVTSLLGPRADLPQERFRGELASGVDVPALEILRGFVRAFHPGIEAARKRREAALREVEAARARRTPDLEVSAAAGRDGDADAVIQLGLEIPLRVFDDGEAAVAAAEARRRRADHEAESALAVAERDLAEAWRLLVAARDRTRLFRDEVVPKAVRAVELTEEGYGKGRFTLLDVLDAQRTLAEARVALVVAAGEMVRAAADVEKVAGTKLETKP